MQNSGVKLSCFLKYVLKEIEETKSVITEDDLAKLEKIIHGNQVDLGEELVRQSHEHHKENGEWVQRMTKLTLWMPSFGTLTLGLLTLWILTS